MSQLGTRTRVIVVAGSLALASTAYGIGSQAGDGTSDAASRKSSKVTASGPGDPAASLAKRLGVSEAALRTAFEDIRKSESPPGGDPRARFEKALAGALGLDQSKVTAALDQLKSKHDAEEKARHDKFAKSLASELGIDAGKVTAAFDKLRPERRGMHGDGPPGGPPPGGAPLGPPPGGPGGPPPGLGGRNGRPGGDDPFLTALAKELGVNRSDLRAALVKLRPKMSKDGARPDGPPAQFVGDLAKALGVDNAALKAALDKIHSQEESDMQARRDKLASALADRLNLPVQKVKDALAAGPVGFGRRAHGGPPPGGPMGLHRGGPMGPPPGAPAGPPPGP
ncbi:MAG: hypothetical protein QOI65_192 [Thermoleophilaceae bacterium]|nr:hypothetical protein [Thermoleophilaceae bacterium]